MSLNKILWFVFFSIFTSCFGQEKKSTIKEHIPGKSNPTIVRNFKAVAVAPDFDTMLVSQYIRSIFQDSKGNMWFGTLGEGVVRYMPSTSFDSAQRAQDRSLSDGQSTLTYFSNSDGFINNTVYAINEDKNGNLWFGTDKGVYKYDPTASSNAFKNYNQKDGLNHLNISRKSILVDKSGTIWVGTYGGVYRYDPAADSKGEPSFSLFQQLPPIDVTGIQEDKSGNIWIASTENGVFRYDPLSTGKNMTIFTDKEDLGNNYAGGMAEDSKGNMWFTMKNGICKFDGKTFIEFTSKDGLGGTEFWGIYIEESGIIWVTARGSTTRFDPSIPLPNSKAFTVFTPTDGLNCCVQSMYQDKSGNMWWGAGSGLYRFDGKGFYQVKKNGPW